ncbi:MAG: hypothetical protein A2008_08430 [Candidatus Wallbacteria bacterium GWC2_49_35]|uniref:Nitrile hydratase alpha /Thiocyanate hydrolase gamma domain-containing protein n=1 Tax=Candidatus Wallbacteria bacterium GWC2_49_35 TaxID=1817813 RepID=A0A1F7WLG1_9BACT|nr:MAG: hypothetical protein A2008_08430 [Candidatus Wallbacteria bacterium GWC2_49_35]HBC76028.1 hypothetical protein [Candidatus Wallbacteria bacterium]
MTDQKKVDSRAVYGEIIAKCWQDENYKKSFMANPKKYLTEAGLVIPEKMEIKAVEQDSKITYVVLPERLSVDILQKLMHSLINDTLHKGFKLPENGELRFVQNTSRLQYFIIPAKLADDELGNADLDMVAGGTGASSIVVITTGPSPVVVVTPIGPSPMIVVTPVGPSPVIVVGPYGPSTPVAAIVVA